MMITRNQTKINTVLTLAVVAMAILGLTVAMANAEVISIDFGGTGADQQSGETTNPNGLQLPGQVGPWDTMPLCPTGQYERSVTVGNVTFTLNPGAVETVSAWPSGGTDPLRKDYFCIISPDRYSGPVIFELTGLDPLVKYDIILFSNVPSQQGKFAIDGHDAGNGVGNAVTNDADGDGNFTGVVPDATGKISGTFDIWASGVWAAFAGLQFDEGGSTDPNAPSVDAGVDMITLSGMGVELDPTVVNNDTEVPQKPLSHIWTAVPDTGVLITEDGINPDDPATKEATVTITKATANPSTVTLTLEVDLVGTLSSASDTMEIDVYDDACLAAQVVSSPSKPFDPSDFDENCTTNLIDYAILAAKWLVDYALTAPVVKP
jgi:hypothetical protein